MGVRTAPRICWTSWRLRTTGSFLDLGGRSNLKQVQLRWRVFWKKNLMAHKAMVAVVRATFFSKGEVEKILAQLIFGDEVGGLAEMFGQRADGADIIGRVLGE